VSAESPGDAPKQATVGPVAQWRNQRHGWVSVSESIYAPRCCGWRSWQFPFFARPSPSRHLADRDQCSRLAASLTGKYSALLRERSASLSPNRCSQSARNHSWWLDWAALHLVRSFPWAAARL